MVNILLGGYGHGKSTYIFNKIKADYENGVRSFLIVPEQETVIAERQIASLLSPRAQLFTEVTNFTRLANRVFREMGGLKYNYVTKSGKNLIMYRTICEVRDILQEYRIPKGRERSCISMFLEAIGEMKSYSVSISDLGKACEEIEDERLKRRIFDIIVIWTTYEKILNESYSDPYDDILMLAKKLEGVSYFKGMNVYIDSFYGFTKSQLDVLSSIFKSAESITIALDCPIFANEASMQYKKIVATKNAILALCAKARVNFDIIPFDVDYKHKSEAVKYACDNLWRFDAKPVKSNGDITLALASDEFEECEFVASQICKLVQSGCKYSDIAIISRNSDTYRGIIDYCLDKFNIPYYFSAPSKLLSVSAIKMLLSSLYAINGYKLEDIINYAKCGYTDISESDLCDFESYVYRWSISGKKFKNDDFWSANPDGYVLTPTRAQTETLKRVNNVRDKILKRLAILEKPFITGGTVTDVARAVYDFVNAHKIKEGLCEEIKLAQGDEAQRLSQVWNAIVTALDNVVNICGDTKTDIEVFTTLFSYAMMDVKIGTIPTGEDNVTIAEASLVRAKSIEHVFILGANEGVFPAIVNESSFFTDSDKVALETIGIELSQKSDIRGDDELLFFKNSIAIASSTVTVTALKSAINGEKRECSIAFNRIKALFDDIEAVDTSCLPIVDKIYSLQMAKDVFGYTDGALHEAIKRISGLCEDEESGFSNENLAITENASKELFGGTLKLSKSSIERFVKCRFNFYCSYALKLKEGAKISFSSVDVGYLVHAIFEHFLTSLKNGSLDGEGLDDEKIEKEVDRIFEEYVISVCGSKAGTNRMKYYFARLKSNVYVFVKNLVEEYRVSSFVPEFFELSFTGDGESGPLPLKFKIDDGTEIIMKGVADRVDLFKTEKTTFVRIVDYKTGSYEFDIEKIDKGLDLQMLIYLFALCKMDDCSFKAKLLGDSEEIRPAGIMYIPLKIKKTTAKTEEGLLDEHSGDIESREIEKKVERNGLILDDDEVVLAQDKTEGGGFSLPKKSRLTLEGFEEIFNRIEASIEKIGCEMLSGVADATPMRTGLSVPCDYCENRPVCRRIGK
ncbi:MAG: PD-(D/E)XK nuclease family protein [Clostridia bacterium]|nr:PD-(D/E)XK nuclease family protein [Clostridia bacterium]